MTKHLVPCECGQAVAVETTQAGDDVTCACGRQVSVPALRSLRQLPRADAVADKPKVRGWSSTQGALFAVGMLLFVCGLVMSAYALLRTFQYDVPPVDQNSVAQWINVIDDLTLDQQWQLWVTARDQGLPQHYSNVTVMRAVAASYRRFLSVALAIATVGLLLSGSAWFIRPAPSRRVAGRRPTRSHAN